MALSLRKISEPVLFPAVRISLRKLTDSVQGKTILITGASFGIGERVTYRLAVPGVHLILVARTADKLLQLKNELESDTIKITVLPADLSKKQAVNNLIETLKSNNIEIDIFINNAGKSIKRSVYDSLERFHDSERLMALNYFAPVALILYLIPQLTKNKGQVINVSAVNVLLIPAPEWSAYQASKSAFDNWLRSVMPELNANGVVVSTVYLTLVRTGMIKPTKAYNNMPAMTATHAADIICKILYQQKRKFVPWWLMYGQLASVLLRSGMESFMYKYLKKRI